MSILIVTDETFDKEVLKADKLVLIAFCAPWCSHCKYLDRVFERVEKKFGEAKYCVINIDENPLTTQTFDIVAIPTVFFIKDGECKKQTIGSRSDTEYLTDIAKILGRNKDEVLHTDYQWSVSRHLKPKPILL